MYHHFKININIINYNNIWVLEEYWNNFLRKFKIFESEYGLWNLEKVCEMFFVKIM